MKGESVIATGSFDASVGVWKRWEQADLNPRPETAEVDFTREWSGDNGTDLTKVENKGDDDEEDEEWRFALVLDGHDSEVKSVAWSAGGNFLATCSRDKSVWIWEEVGEDDFETIAVMQEHQGDVKSVAWHPEEELLASASYDDDIRLWREDVDDWGCVSILKGHESTVWAVEWETLKPPLLEVKTEERTATQRSWVERREASGPRLVSCSDDITIRVWRRKPRQKGPEQSKLSIIRTGSNEEDWVEEAQLPKRHMRAIYSLAWSKKTGRIVSTGGDGKIVVYEEGWYQKETGTVTVPDGHTNGGDSELMQDIQSDKTQSSEEATEWNVIAELEGAHGAFEVNHVCWAPRADRNKSEDEEVVLSTGDDGIVKVWVLDF